ncbi:MAG: Magnesium and cobalt transport protein CorA [Myxococcales bacterium]|nr:Magnesium and cobalt transport protein CorA [Myxococcales bacterium]
MRMYARILDHDKLRTTADYAEIKRAIDHKVPIWVELEAKTPETDDFLANELKLHPLTIEDIWNDRTFPKLDDFDNYLYVIIHGVRTAKDSPLELVELDVVIGPHYVVTHDPSGIMAKDLCDELERSPRLLAKGPAWIAHAALDHAVDRYLPVVDQLDSEVESLEDEVLRKAGTPSGPPVLRRILKFKRMLQGLRRTSIHQREILLRLARGEFDEIPKEAVPFYRDVYDHFLRVNDLVDGYRDLVTSSLEAYLSVQSNRMNEIMKTLTLAATMILPITFIAGVYGMNFETMPELHWKYGYLYVIVLMAAVTGASALWFRRKGWIGNRENDLPED